MCSARAVAHSTFLMIHVSAWICLNIQLYNRKLWGLCMISCEPYKSKPCSSRMIASWIRGSVEVRDMWQHVLESWHFWRWQNRSWITPDRVPKERIGAQIWPSPRYLLLAAVHGCWCGRPWSTPNDPWAAVPALAWKWTSLRGTPSHDRAASKNWSFLGVKSIARISVKEDKSKRTSMHKPSMVSLYVRYAHIHTSF